MTAEVRDRCKVHYLSSIVPKSNSVMQSHYTTQLKTMLYRYTIPKHQVSNDIYNLVRTKKNFFPKMTLSRL